MKLSEQLVVITIIGILIAFLFPSIVGIKNRIELSTAINTLAQAFRKARMDSIGEFTPMTVCIAEVNKKVAYANISGGNCDKISNWQYLGSGVIIDRPNSTFRTVTGVAGNGGKVYRASWGDTEAGLGGSWGQLGRITLVQGKNRKCIFLSNVKGDFDVREGKRCIK
ncbi:MAG TPA: type II secretion system protein [Nostocaceae cyanobacterium]|nr:type II secretion system protein [Nostocaceae cyanobacterium]